MLIPTTQELGINSVSVGLLPALHVPMLWDQMEPILLKYGQDFLTIVDEKEVLAGIYTGNYEAWCGMDSGVLEGFAICCWERHNRASFYHISAVMGTNMRKYFRTGMEKIEQYASLMGASQVVMEGRKEWQRLLSPRGFAPQTVRLRKTVSVMWRQ